MSYYKRTDLAKNYASRIMSTAVISPAASGVFLAAPRRTGKSTFMRQDLQSELQQAGALVVYADLWENRAANPGRVIAGAIARELEALAGLLTRLAKKSGVDKIAVAGVSVALDKGGKSKELSLTEALEHLSAESGKRIVLIIDEAQHALTTKEGEDALFGLKAARDKLNGNGSNGLRVVCTGSNRNKLALLTTGKEQAFLGAQLIEFPLLDKGYVEWFCKNIDLGGPLDADKVAEVFVRAGNRPEILTGAAQQLQFDFVDPSEVSERFISAAEAEIVRLDNAIVPIINALTPLQKAVLQVMTQTGVRYAPFEAKTLHLYSVALMAAGVQDPKVDTPGVQQALAALKEKYLVWQAKRGSYDLEDASLIRHMPPLPAVTAAIQAAREVPPTNVMGEPTAP